MALDPFRDELERLKAIPGVSTTAAQVLLAEIGMDMGRFPTVGHLLSWAGLESERANRWRAAVG